MSIQNSTAGNKNLRPYQEDLIAKIRDAFVAGHKSVLLQLPTGAGKCLGVNTPILMFDGSIKMVQDVNVGDDLMGPDSMPRRVESICSGREMLYRVTPTRAGESYVINESHILSLKRTPISQPARYPSHVGGGIVNISLIKYLSSSKYFKHLHKGWRTGVDFPPKPRLMVDPYFIGLWLGDGCSLNPSITTGDEVIKDYLSSFASHAGLQVRIQENSENSQVFHISTGTMWGAKNRNTLRAQMNHLGLFRNKHIPLQYKTSSREERLALLAGIIDSDGYNSGKGFEITQKDEALLDDIIFVARSLGFSASKSRISKKCHNNGVVGWYWSCCINGDINQIPCKLERKKAKPRTQKKSHLVSAINVEKLEVGDYYGFEISGPDRLFLLGDFTVTHNTLTTATMIKRALAKGNKAWFLCHRRELVNQSGRAFREVGIPHGYIAAGSYPNLMQPVQICSIQTVANRMRRLKAPQLIVYDECFPAGTMVGSVKIQDLKVGDYVDSWSCGAIERRRIVRLFKKNPSSLMTVTANGVRVSCTTEHPFYTKRGWVKAQDLTISDVVLTITSYELQNMRERYSKKQKDLLNSVSEQVSVNDNGKNQQGSRLAELSSKGNARLQKSYALERSQGDGVDEVKGYGPQTKDSGWEWKAASSPSGCNGYGAWLGDRAWCLHKYIQRKWLRIRLQARHRECQLEDWRGNRWCFPWRSCSENAGQEEGGVLSWHWVEDIKVHQPTGDGGFGGLCPDGFVYNIEVEKNHNYFANGVLVHNCHHTGAKTWSDTIKYFKSKGCKIIGLTATPERLDGKGLGEHFDVMVEGPTVAWLIENGFLSKFKVFAPSSVSTEGIHTRMGDYAKDELDALMDKPSITGNAVENYLKYARGKKALCFCVSIAHSKHVVEQFTANGISSAHIDGTMDSKERDKIVADFSSGKFLVLSNVEILGEGFDVPSAEAAILLRPTQSVSLHLQQCGRILRPSPGKEFSVILDHAGNCLRHGLPDDEREWSLAGREQKKRGDSKSSLTVRQCKVCYHVQPAKFDVCQHCGEVLKGEGRKVDEKEGDLVEVTRDRKKIERQEQGRAHSLDALIELGKARGYKQPHAWAQHIIRARNK